MSRAEPKKTLLTRVSAWKKFERNEGVGCGVEFVRCVDVVEKRLIVAAFSVLSCLIVLR